MGVVVGSPIDQTIGGFKTGREMIQELSMSKAGQAYFFKPHFRQHRIRAGTTTLATFFVPQNCVVLIE
jgi:hypothetical protein